MRVMQQFSIAMHNEPGRLEEFCNRLADHDVNILAMSVSGDAGQCTFRMIVDQSDTAREMLEEKTEMTWSTQDVVATEVPNKSGAMAALAAKLAAAGVNIDYLYGSVLNTGANSLVVLGVSDVKKAVEVLKEE